MKKIILALLLVSLVAMTGCSKEEEKKSLKDATELSDFKGAKIAVQSGTIHQEVVTQIPQVNAPDYPELADLVVALKANTVDGFVADEPQAIAVCGKDDSLTYIKLLNNKTGFEVATNVSGVSIGVADKSPLRDEINAVLDTLTVADTDRLMEQVIQISLGNKIDKFDLYCEEPAEYKGTLRVGMECCSEPFNWTDTDGATLGAVPICGEGKDGLYANGFDVQLAKYICNKLGYKLEVYEVDWDSLIPSVQAGTIDAIVSSMSPTDVREEVIDFTHVYYDINLVIVIAK